MDKSIPSSVTRYLESLQQAGRALVYIGLDEELCVKTWGGELALCGLDTVDFSTPVISQIEFLADLIPSGSEPVVIQNAQLCKNTFFDLHLFTAMECQWILLLDNTVVARNLQSDQQKRLDKDIVTEKKKKSV